MMADNNEDFHEFDGLDEWMRAEVSDFGFSTISPEDIFNCDDPRERVSDKDKLCLKLKELGRNLAKEFHGYGQSAHPASNNSLFNSVATHYRDTKITALSIYTKISEEAKRMAKYYAVFLPNAERDLESMISQFEDEGDGDELYSHLAAVIDIAENALGKEIIVLNGKGEIKSFGREEKKTTNESIVIVDFGNGFGGTHLSQHIS
ncbi:uncharacterized protein [Watersipora subatra]|uniref:uncharacterized protein isoform X1 n=1 Tax=Watersipora subatra TaxID=2589382 RepID=UPI00355BD651